MTVADLILRLSQMPPDLPVVIDGQETQYALDSVEVREVTFLPDGRPADGWEVSRRLWDAASAAAREDLLRTCVPPDVWDGRRPEPAAVLRG